MKKTKDKVTETNLLHLHLLRVESQIIENDITKKALHTLFRHATSKFQWRLREARWNSSRESGRGREFTVSHPNQNVWKIVYFEQFVSLKHAFSEWESMVLLREGRRIFIKKENQCASKILSRKLLASKFALGGIPLQAKKLASLFISKKW